jgi:transcriptional regulator with XRE-family HTH domain
MRPSEFRKKMIKENPSFKDAIDKVKKDIKFQTGQELLKARLIKGMTQAELAKKIGTKQPSIAKIENGTVAPSLKFLDKIAKLWGAYLLPPRFSFTIEGNEAEGGITVSDYSEKVRVMSEEEYVVLRENRSDG